jgi:hypothetical protein
MVGNRDKLRRIGEIRDGLTNPGSPNTYSLNFEDPNGVGLVELKRKQFADIEEDLSGLDSAAWKHLKPQVTHLFGTKDPIRGWQAAFDRLNEAKAYNHLLRLGVTDLKFIPQSTISGKKTPDLHGRLGQVRVLCEVKTINPSDNEAVVRHRGIVRDIQHRLPNAFFEKLAATLKAAGLQMASDCPTDTDIRRIVYVILNFDDSLHEYVEDYLEQLRSFVVAAPLPKAEIVFDVKPKYYFAMADSPASQLFACSMDRAWYSLEIR